MIVSLDEAKLYLRVDGDDDDSLITNLITTSEQLVADVARQDLDTTNPIYRIAILYTIAYLYENRETANHNALTLTLRALLFGAREAQF